jgi:hypothetical protein
MDRAMPAVEFRRDGAPLRVAHVFDPVLAVLTSLIEPFPRHIARIDLFPYGLIGVAFGGYPENTHAFVSPDRING